MLLGLLYFLPIQFQCPKWLFLHVLGTDSPTVNRFTCLQCWWRWNCLPQIDMPQLSSPRNRSDQCYINVFGFLEVRVWAIGKNGPSNQAALRRTLRSRSSQKATELIYRRSTRCCLWLKVMRADFCLNWTWKYGITTTQPLQRSEVSARLWAESQMD